MSYFNQLIQRSASSVPTTMLRPEVSQMYYAKPEQPVTDPFAETAPLPPLTEPLKTGKETATSQVPLAFPKSKLNNLFIPVFQPDLEQKPFSIQPDLQPNITQDTKQANESAYIEDFREKEQIQEEKMAPPMLPSDKPLLQKETIIEKVILPKKSKEIPQIHPQDLKVDKSEPENIKQTIVQKEKTERVVIKPKQESLPKLDIQQKKKTYLQPAANINKPLSPKRRPSNNKLSIGRISVEIVKSSGAKTTVATQKSQGKRSPGKLTGSNSGIRYNKRFGLGQL